MPIENKVYKVCKHCNSENITGSASTTWDFYEQLWVLDEDDNYYCRNCCRDTGVKNLYLQIEDEE